MIRKLARVYRMKASVHQVCLKTRNIASFFSPLDEINQRCSIFFSPMAVNITTEVESVKATNRILHLSLYSLIKSNDTFVIRGSRLKRHSKPALGREFFRLISADRKGSGRKMRFASSGLTFDQGTRDFHSAKRRSFGAETNANDFFEIEYRRSGSIVFRDLHRTILAKLRVEYSRQR